MSTAADALAYFWGEDAFGIEHAAALLVRERSARAGGSVDVFRISADDGDTDDNGGASGSGSGGSGRRRARVLDEVDQRTSTGTLFGSGTVVVLRQPASLVREQAARDRLLAIVDRIAPGNALVFLDLVAPGARGPAQGGVLRDAVAARGGRVQDFPAPKRERMQAWITTRATEIGARLAPGAAQLLAERIGAYVREGDIDRRRQTELANAELEKLALYRPDGAITPADVEALVSEAVPGSSWAFQDAVGERRGHEAAMLIGRLLHDAVPLPVLVTQIHRRLRDLIVIRDHIAAGTKPADIVREMKLQPFRAEKLTQQSRTWQQAELDEALADLQALDLLSKGIADDGSPRSMSDARSWLALVAWLTKHVGRVGGVTRPTAWSGPAPVGTRR